MRFQVLSHAALLIENGVRLLVDPWLSGSCYWTSWWHFPEAVPLETPLSKGDYIYITHGHWDHFHFPSLREIDREVTVLIPRLPFSYLLDPLHELGFESVVEMHHGKEYQIAPDLHLTSYQTDWKNDSALMIESPDATIVDFNDAKFQENTLARIVREHPRIDFMLKSHSSASGYPDCFESPDPSDLELYTEQDFIGNFFHYASVCGARYAVPFASNVCFLHEETVAYNDMAISPSRLLTEAEPRSPDGTEVKLMLPGDSWSLQDGFQIVSGDVLERRASELERLAREAAAQLAAQAESERRTQLRFESFESYFGDFLRSLPLGIGLIYRHRIAFEIAQDSAEWWVLDFGRRRVVREETCPDDVIATISIPPGLLQQAIDEHVVGFVDISKRMHVKLRPGKVVQYSIYKELLNLYEAGYFPLRSNLNARFLGAWLRRRQEVWSYFKKALRGPLSFVPKAPGLTEGGE